MARRDHRSIVEEAPWLPVGAAAAAITTWGVASPLIKFASLGGPALAFYRLAGGVLALSAIMALARQPVTLRGARWAALGGAFFGVNMVMYVLALKLTAVANATLIGALQPALTAAVAGPMFGEQVTRREVAWIGAAIGGVALVIAGSAGSAEWNPAGDALALGAVLTFTAYFLVTKQARTHVGTLEYMTGIHVAAAVIAAPVALSDPGGLWPLETRDWLIVGFFALVSGTAGQFVIGWAHRYVDVSLSSLMMLGVPVIATLAAWPMLGEAIGPLQFAGAGITLAALAAMLRRPTASIVQDVRATDGAL